MGEETLTEFETRVVALLLSSRPGDLLTYGEVAAEAGRPGAARAVGNFLSRTVRDDLPWWRVVAANGRLIPHNPGRHAELLAAEGFVCHNGRVVGPRP